MLPLLLAAIGTPGLIQVLASDPDGSWVVICQDRSPKDAAPPHADPLAGMKPFLVRGDGPGEPIDSFVAGQEGRAVVVRRGRLVLTGRDGEKDLGQAPVGAAHAPLASFDRKGHLLYLVDRGGRLSPVLRELASGRERVLPISGSVTAAELDEEGFLVDVDEASGDESQSRSARHAPAPSCAQHDPPIDSYTRPLPRPATHVFRLADGSLHQVRGFIRSMGRSVLRRDVDGAVLLDRLDGSRPTVLAGSACRGSVREVDPERERAVIACGGTRELFLAGRGFEKVMGELKGMFAALPLSRAPSDMPRFSSSRWVSSGQQVVDMNDGEALWRTNVLDPEAFAISWGDAVLLLQDHRLVRAGQPDQLLDLPRIRFGPAQEGGRHPRLQAGPVAVVWVPDPNDTWWASWYAAVDLARGVITERTDRTPLAVRTDGALLVSPAVRDFQHAWPTGPLEWLR